MASVDRVLVDPAGVAGDRPWSPSLPLRWCELLKRLCKSSRDSDVCFLTWASYPWREEAVSGSGELVSPGAARHESYLVDPASSHMLVSKTKPCMSKYKRFYTVKLRMAH